MRDPAGQRSIVYAASMLALAFLGRNEAVAAAALGLTLVVTVVYPRSVGTRRERLMTAATDGTIFVMPFATTFAAWAIAGYVLTHQLLAQFEANALQVSIAGIRLQSATSRFSHEIHALWYIAPLLPIAVIMAIVVARKRHDSQPWAILCILGGCLTFSLISYLNGSIFPWFRFYILAVPIEVLLVGYALSSVRSAKHPGASTGGPVDAATTSNASSDEASPVSHRRASTALSVIGSVAALAVLGPSLPATAKGMLNPVIGPEETQDLGFVFHHRLTPADLSSKDHYAHIVSISDYIGRLHLADGSVLVDDSVACVPEVIVTSSNARVFVIPNDRDFQQILADPLTFGTHFMLVPAPVGLSADNAMNNEYPNIYGGRTSFVSLVHSFPGTDNCPAFHLFRVVGHPSG